MKTLFTMLLICISCAAYRIAAGGIVTKHGTDDSSSAKASVFQDTLPSFDSMLLARIKQSEIEVRHILKNAQRADCCVPVFRNDSIVTEPGIKNRK